MSNHEISANSKNIFKKNCEFRIFSLKNCQEMWGVGTCDFYINFSRTHSYANTRESGSNPLCEFQRDQIGRASCRERVSSPV